MGSARATLTAVGLLRELYDGSQKLAIGSPVAILPLNMPQMYLGAFGVLYYPQNRSRQYFFYKNREIENAWAILCYAVTVY